MPIRRVLERIDLRRALASWIRGSGRLAQAFVREWLEILAPSYCRYCGRDVSEPAAGFCAECLAAIEWIGGACFRCGMPLVNPPRARAREAPCFSCAPRRFHFDRAAAGGRYDGALRTAVVRFKFHRDPAVLSVLETALLRAASSEAVARSIAEAGALVPVPLHPIKAFWRGWNPVEELARGLAGRLPGGREVPVLRALKKVRWTRAQAKLPEKERRRNLRRAFRARRGLRIPKTVVLIDDVLTTGTTASECALALKRAGAERVVVIAAARS